MGVGVRVRVGVLVGVGVGVDAIFTLLHVRAKRDSLLYTLSVSLRTQQKLSDMQSSLSGVSEQPRATQKK